MYFKWLGYYLYNKLEDNTFEWNKTEFPKGSLSEKELLQKLQITISDRRNTFIFRLSYNEQMESVVEKRQQRLH